MATKKKQKQYGPLGHEKACDFVKIIATTCAGEPSRTIIQFYKGKAFTSENIFGELTEENICTTGRLWRKMYSESGKNIRKTCSQIAGRVWRDAKKAGKVILKAAPDGKILKYYPMSGTRPDGIDALVDSFSFDALVEIPSRHQD